MITDTRSQKLLEIIAKGLEQQTRKNTQTQLGDRLEYIGMSDIGSYMTCPRMAILNKMKPQNSTGNLQKLLTLQRGHWFEDGIADALTMLNFPMVRQLEISVPYTSTPVKAHLDFVLASTIPIPTVRILEIKSCQKIPDSLYSSYESQVYGQVGMFCRYWEEPVFSVRDESGAYRWKDKPFPELAHHLWGMKLPYEWENVDIEAWILCLSMTDAKVFGPYMGYSGMDDFVLNKATELWETFQQVQGGTLGISTLKTAAGFNPLCEYCNWNTDCPKYAGIEHAELTPELDELAAWKAERKLLEDKISAREAAVKSWYAHTAETQDGWIHAGKYRFKASELSDRRTLDKESLAEELIELFHDGGMDDVDVPALIARHEKTSSPTTRLFISTINHP